MTTQTGPSTNAKVASTDSQYNGVSLSTREMPALRAARGGDWCETFLIGDGVVALSIGTASGSGTTRFATKAFLREAIREAALAGADPGEALAAANLALTRRSGPTQATALFALLDTRRAGLTFANAGHPPPLAMGPRSSGFLAYAVGDAPLGTPDATPPRVRAVAAPMETLLVLYTAGLVADRLRPSGGDVELRRASRQAYGSWEPSTAAHIERLMFVAGQNLDDVAILTARMPRASLWRGPRAIGTARRRRLRAASGL